MSQAIEPGASREEMSEPESAEPVPELSVPLVGILWQRFGDADLEAAYTAWRGRYSQHHVVQLIMALVATLMYFMLMMMGPPSRHNIVQDAFQHGVVQGISGWMALGNMCLVVMYWGLVAAAWILRRQTGVSRLPDWPVMFVAGVVVAYRSFTPMRALALTGGHERAWADYLGDFYERTNTSAPVCKAYVHVALNGTAVPGCADPDDDSCTVRCYHTGHEAFSLLTIVAVNMSVGLYFRVRPSLLLLLAHFSAAWYLAIRLKYLEPDSNPNQRYLDAMCLYVVLLLVCAAAHSAELSLRDVFLLQHALGTLASQQHAEITRLDERLIQLEPLQLTATEQKVLEAELGADSLGDALRRAQIDFGELQIREALGDGAFGEVHLAMWRGTPCAVKRLRRDRLGQASLQGFKEELRLHLSLRHPNIVGLIGCSFSAEHGSVCAVLELHGTLEELLEQRRAALSWSAHKLPLALGVARALAYLHAQSPPILHRDLKCANVLVDAGYNAKLADFGLSREEAADVTMSRAGSPIYSAPELLRLERYGASVDCWSYGCLLEQLHTHAPIFAYSGVPRRRGGAKRREAVHKVAEGSLRPTVPAGSFFADVVERCAQYDAEARPAMESVADELGLPAKYAEALLLPPGPGPEPPSQVRAVVSRPSSGDDDEWPSAEGARDAASGPGTPLVSGRSPAGGRGTWRGRLASGASLPRAAGDADAAAPAVGGGAAAAAAAAPCASHGTPRATSSSTCCATPRTPSAAASCAAPPRMLCSVSAVGTSYLDRWGLQPARVSPTAQPPSARLSARRSAGEAGGVRFSGLSARRSSAHLSSGNPSAREAEPRARGGGGGERAPPLRTALATVPSTPSSRPARSGSFSSGAHSHSRSRSAPGPQEDSIKSEVALNAVL